MAGNWDIRRLYLYLVSFATLMMIIIGTVLLLQGVIDLVYKSPTPLYYYGEVKPIDPSIRNNPDLSPAEVKKLEEEAKKQQEKAREDSIKMERHNKIRSVINYGILLVVSSPVYLYHWRKIQRTEGPPAV